MLWVDRPRFRVTDPVNFAGIPHQADIVLLRFAEGHERPNPKRDDGQTDRRPDAPADVLPVAQFGYRVRLDQIGWSSFLWRLSRI
jgi:hypothetical protein